MFKYLPSFKVRPALLGAGLFVLGIGAGFLSQPSISSEKVFACFNDPFVQAVAQTEGYLNTFTLNELRTFLSEAPMPPQDRAKFEKALDFAQAHTNPKVSLTSQGFTTCLNK